MEPEKFEQTIERKQKRMKTSTKPSPPERNEWRDISHLIHSLPPELLDFILSFLDLPTLLSIRASCKRFHDKIVVEHLSPTFTGELKPAIGTENQNQLYTTVAPFVGLEGGLNSVFSITVQVMSHDQGLLPSLGPGFSWGELGFLDLGIEDEKEEGDAEREQEEQLEESGEQANDNRGGMNSDDEALDTTAEQSNAQHDASTIGTMLFKIHNGFDVTRFLRMNNVTVSSKHGGSLLRRRSHNNQGRGVRLVVREPTGINDYRRMVFFVNKTGEYGYQRHCMTLYAASKWWQQCLESGCSTLNSDSRLGVWARSLYSGWLCYMNKGLNMWRVSIRSDML